MLKVGVIGPGWVAKNRHIPSFIKSRGAKIEAVMDPSIKKAEAVAEKFGAPKAYDDVETLLKQPLDIVDICTPPFTHRDLVIKAAEAGYHIFVEKPLAINSEECEEMINAVQRNNVKLCVSHNFLFSRSMTKARSLRDSNMLGQVTGAIAFQMANLKRRLPSWFPSLPGGLFFDESPHMLYSILEFLGDVSVRWANTEKWEDNRQPLSRVEASMTSQTTDATSYLHFNFNAPRDEWFLLIMGTKRVLLIDLFRDTIIEIEEGGEHTPFEVLKNSLGFMWQNAKETAISGSHFLSKNLYFGHDEIIRRFVNSVEKDTDPPVNGEEGKKVIELIEQILKKG